MKNGGHVTLSGSKPELDSSLGPLGCRNKGHVIWPRAEQGVAVLTPAQLSMLLEGIDWRRPVRTA
jgi:hypothetical protein